ncbi:MAG: RdgB/HAM1 family non-canonical purine NTP pyrophosphatase [Chitinispirillaceae bacterium]|nr:RdgB/HAM1 family non-canonical purine NTP pyrophosphatase [Chitinispirillaceae bacterium]
MRRRIIVATANSGKLREIVDLFADVPCQLLSMRECWNPLPSIEENGSTFFENACIKANWVFRRSAEWALADDSGLMVDALDGGPGVKSARFAGEQGNGEANNIKLLKALENVACRLRTARFVCSAVLRIDENTLLHADGYCEGLIIDKPRGSGGFGYDPLFVPEGFNRTFAELTSEEKHSISHRGKALKALKEQLYDYLAR